MNKHISRNRIVPVKVDRVNHKWPVWSVHTSSGRVFAINSPLKHVQETFDCADLHNAGEILEVIRVDTDYFSHNEHTSRLKYSPSLVQPLHRAMK